MRRVLVAILSLAALGAAPAHVRAQQNPDPYLVRSGEAARLLDFFVARSRMELGSGTTRLDGFGGRVMWSLAATPAPWGSRTWLGGYLVHTPQDQNDAAMWHYGVQTDLKVAPAPLAGRVDPLLSLGVGAVRVEEPVKRLVPPPMVLLDRGPGTGSGIFAPRPVDAAPREMEARTSLSLVPGVGARVRLTRGLDFRSDVRVLMDFRSRTTRNVEVSGGISVPA